jgi:hypothetical protein
MLLAYAENLADLGAVVARLRKRADLVRLGGQSVRDSPAGIRVFMWLLMPPKSLTVLNAFDSSTVFIRYVINRIIMGLLWS